MSKKSRQKAPTSSKETTSSSKVKKSKNDVLLEEIIALGGDAKDLEIVQGLDSDQDNGHASTSQAAKIAKVSSV